MKKEVSFVSARVKSFKPVFLALTTVPTSTAEDECLFRKHSNSASFGHECESPLYYDEEAIGEPNEEIDVDHHPEQPGGKS